MRRQQQSMVLVVRTVLSWLRPSRGNQARRRSIITDMSGLRQFWTSSISGMVRNMPNIRASLIAIRAIIRSATTRMWLQGSRIWFAQDLHATRRSWNRSWWVGVTMVSIIRPVCVRPAIWIMWPAPVWWPTINWVSEVVANGRTSWLPLLTIRITAFSRMRIMNVIRSVWI